MSVVTMDQFNGEITVTELNVLNAEGTYYSAELTEIKERLIPLAKDVEEKRVSYLTALFNVEKLNELDVKAVTEKETALAELSASKVGVLDAISLMAINKAEKEAKEEIAANKEINVTLAENRKDLYETAADEVFIALEAYTPVLVEIRAEYTDTKSNRTAKVYDSELAQFTAVYKMNGQGTFYSLKAKIQPVWNYNMDVRRFETETFRGHLMQTYSYMTNYVND